MKYVILLFFLSFTLLYAAVRETAQGIEFSYEAANAGEVFLAGSFNDWNTTKNPLKKGADGVWRTTLKLASGSYQYKFVVDGNWNFDQDNPKTEDDGYGGANSLIEVDSKGKLVSETKTVVSDGIQATFNPKIHFSGRYYALNQFQKNDNNHFMLDKPEHDLNFGIKVKFNNDFEGYTLLNVNNVKEGSDMWKTHLNYKKAYLKLNTSYFNLLAFDDFGAAEFDDPLKIVGDIGRYGYQFGYGKRGIYVSTMDLLQLINYELPLQLTGNFIFADELGDAERDTEAGRLKLVYEPLKVSTFTLGASKYISQNKMNDDVHQKYDNYEFDFGYEHAFEQSGWTNPMILDLKTEYFYYENKNEFSKFGEDPYIINKEYVWNNGEKWFFGSELHFPKALKLNLNYQKHIVNFYLEEEQEGIVFTPSPNLVKKSVTRDLYSFGSQFEIEKFQSGIEFEYRKTAFPDSLINWTNYYIYMEKTNGTGRWFDKHTYVPLENYSIIGYKTGLLIKANAMYQTKLLNHRFDISWQGKFTHHDWFKEVKYAEHILCGTFYITKQWQLYSNTRLPVYNDKVMGIVTKFSDNKDVFISNYSEIRYQLNKNVRLSLGWGVNPYVISQVTDEFYDGGREEFMESADNYPEYIEATYKGIGRKIRNAEKALQNEQRISLEAVLTF
jgi:hypothetical protein